MGAEDDSAAVPSMSFREQGSTHFKAGQYLKAAAMYTKAIGEDPNNAVLYSNLSAALFKLKKMSKALSAADDCIRLDPLFEKGYYRRGVVLEATDKCLEALASFFKAWQLNKCNPEICGKLVALSRKAKTASLQVPEDVLASLPEIAAGAPVPTKPNTGGSGFSFGAAGPSPASAATASAGARTAPATSAGNPTSTSGGCEASEAAAPAVASTSGAPSQPATAASRPAAASSSAAAPPGDSGQGQAALAATAGSGATAATTADASTTAGALPGVTFSGPANAMLATLKDSAGGALAADFLSFAMESVGEGYAEFVPSVHFLPGPSPPEPLEDDQAHVRAEAAFQSPDTLGSFVGFLRSQAARLDARAVVALVPRHAVAYPQVWVKGGWPHGAAGGIFVQLECKELRRIWFVMAQPGVDRGALSELPYDKFALLPNILST